MPEAPRLSARRHPRLSARTIRKELRDDLIPCPIHDYVKPVATASVSHLPFPAEHFFAPLTRRAPGSILILLFSMV